MGPLALRVALFYPLPNTAMMIACSTTGANRLRVPPRSLTPQPADRRQHDAQDERRNTRRSKQPVIGLFTIHGLVGATKRSGSGRNRAQTACVPSQGALAQQIPISVMQSVLSRSFQVHEISDVYSKQRRPNDLTTSNRLPALHSSGRTVRGPSQAGISRCSPIMSEVHSMVVPLTCNYVVHTPDGIFASGQIALAVLHDWTMLFWWR